MDKGRAAEYLQVRRARFNQFVDELIENKAAWIGETLIDNGPGGQQVHTEILDICRDEKQETFFWILGRKFNCGVHTNYGSVDVNRSSDEHIVINGYGSHVFEIRKE